MAEALQELPSPRCVKLHEICQEEIHRAHELFLDALNPHNNLVIETIHPEIRCSR